MHEALTKQVPKKKRQPPKQNIARKSNRSRASGKGETPQPVDLTEEGEEEDAAPVLDVEQVLAPGTSPPPIWNDMQLLFHPLICFCD